MANIERALATVRTIKSLTPIEGADRIELAKFTTCGWQCVVNKGLYSVGDMVVFCEVDSWIPNQLAPFLTKPGQYPKEYEGVPGQRLKSIKLKGTLSQGLVLCKVDRCNDGTPFISTDFIEDGIGMMTIVEEDMDVTQGLGILKWEKPISNSGKNGGSYAKPAGSFPTHLVSKTDQERIQNCAHHVEKKIRAEGFIEMEVTEKLDGSSMTMIVHNGEFMVCSRNNKLKEPTPEDEGVNNFWMMAKLYQEAMTNFHVNTGRAIAVQGELTAHNIQGNPYNLPSGAVRFHAFDVFDIDTQKYLTSEERLELLNSLRIPSVPVLTCLIMSTENLDSLDNLCDYLLYLAEGKSQLADVLREGIVFKDFNNPEFSFKAISNSWLVKKDSKEE